MARGPFFRANALAATRVLLPVVPPGREPLLTRCWCLLRYPNTLLPQDELEGVHQESDYQLTLIEDATAEVHNVHELKSAVLRREMEAKVDAYVAEQKVLQ